MKFSNFLFPESRAKENDFTIIDDALKEARLCDELGYDAVWLAEHHFDGGCAYVEPCTFAAAIAAQTSQIKIGFAVAQMAIHHPVRLAEEVALIDNISQGRMLLGVGRGTAFNFYEYRGFGIDPAEAQERFLESEEILFKIWTSNNYKHEGKYWNFSLPELRPDVYQKPYPPIIRACSSIDSTLEMARAGRPFMMNIQDDETTIDRFSQFRNVMAESGYDEERIEQTVANSWVWRNIFVAETDVEAERIGAAAFTSMREYLNGNRHKLNTAEEMARVTAGPAAARNDLDRGMIYGSPATVAEKLKPLQKANIGGVIIHFRLGPMTWEDVENSLTLFAQKVVPEFKNGSGN